MSSAVDVEEDPVEDAPLDEGEAASPWQPATITAPSNPTTNNRCIVESPHVSSDLEPRQPVQDAKEGTQRQRLSDTTGNPAILVL